MAQTAHRSTSRVLDIFELLSTTSSDGATLTEIAQALESPKSSILPILQTLVARGYIDMDYRTNKYSISIWPLQFTAARSLSINLSTMRCAI